MRNISNITSLLIIIVLSFSACKQDASTTSTSGLFGNNEALNKLQTEYEKAPSVTTANPLLKELLASLSQNEFDKSKQKQYLEYGLKVSTDQNIATRKAGFLMALLKDDYGHVDTPQRLFELTQIMHKMKKSSVSNTLASGLVANFSNSPNAAEAKKLISPEVKDIDAYIMDLGKKIFENPDNTGINRNASLAYVDACEAYALAYPNSKNTPEYLFKAAEVAKSLRTFPKSLTLYDWVIDKYPNFEKAGTSLFLKGFIIENNLGDDTKAREVYNEFLKRFPNHDLADDVEFLIENLGKTDEEILEMIESKQKK